MNNRDRAKWESLYSASYYWKHGMGCWAIKPPYRGKEDMHFFWVLPPDTSKPIQESNLTLTVSLGFQVVTIVEGKVKYSENKEKARHELPRRKRAIIVEPPLVVSNIENKPVKVKKTNRLMTLFRGVITQTTRNLESRRGIKEDVIWHYSFGSMRCAACGFNDMRSLSIDHIAGGGRKHLREIKGSLYSWLKRNNYPLGFQVLCMNCQYVKRVQYQECKGRPQDTMNHAQGKLL
jgi:hypothetical protein